MIRNDKIKGGIAMQAPGYVILTLSFHRERGRWTAHCQELGTATFARSLDAAKERIREAISLHLNTLEDVGERERFFRQHKITFHRFGPAKAKRPPKIPDTAEITASFDENTFVQPYLQPLTTRA